MPNPNTILEIADELDQIAANLSRGGHAAYPAAWQRFVTACNDNIDAIRATKSADLKDVEIAADASLQRYRRALGHAPGYLEHAATNLAKILRNSAAQKTVPPPT